MLVTWNHQSDGIGAAEADGGTQFRAAGAGVPVRSIAERRLLPARGIVVGVLGSLAIWTVLGAALLSV